MTADPNLSVLVVDDDDVAIEGVQRALREVEDVEVLGARDGQLALQILRGDGTSRLRGKPIVLLDLNMPTMNGEEFLAELRQDSALRNTVVFVLSTSGEPEDRSRAYSQGVAGYIEKHRVGPRFCNVRALVTGYLNAVSLP